MPVYEVLHATGEWSVKLREETPIAVRDAITVPFGHLVVTSTHLPVDRFTGSQILNAALYSGVCLRPGPGLEISGKGLAWWLDQAVLETAVTNNAASLSTWLNDILQADSSTYPVSITSGGAATVAGTLSTSFQWVTRRQALDAVVRYYWGLEWKIRPSFDLVANSVTAIYGANPVAMIAARADGYEQAFGMWGLSGQSRTAIDFESYATRVVAVGQDQIGGASITSIYRDPQGNVLSIGRMIDAPSTGQGLATSVATQVLATLDQPTYDFRLSAERYVISNRAPVGSTVNVYDPLNGFVDPANPVRFGGSTYFPRAVRLVGCRWPIEQGMGVYFRWYDPDDGSGPFMTDLTDYVEWETGAAELEVGTRMRGLDSSDSTLATLAGSPVDSGAWTEYAVTASGISLGNGTARGWYRKDGATLFLSIVVIAGSTTANGSGLWTVNLPDSLVAATQSNRIQHLVGVAYDSSAEAGWRLVGEIQPNNDAIIMLFDDNGPGYTNYLAGAAPFSVATGDQFNLSGVIEVSIAGVETSVPVLGVIADQLWTVDGAAISAVVPTVTSGTLPITWSASGLPPGLSIDSATGAISGTITETYDNSTGLLVGGYAGTATVTATNSAGSDSDSFDWTLMLTGELVIEAYIDPDMSWSAVSGFVPFVEKWQTAGDQRSFQFGYDASGGYPNLRFSETGTSVVRNMSQSSTYFNNSSSTANYIKVVVVEATRPNAAQDVHAFFYESTDGTSWRAMGGATAEQVTGENGFFRGSATPTTLTPTGYAATSVQVDIDGVQVIP